MGSPAHIPIVDCGYTKYGILLVYSRYSKLFLYRNISKYTANIPSWYTSGPLLAYRSHTAVKLKVYYPCVCSVGLIGQVGCYIIATINTTI